MQTSCGHFLCLRVPLSPIGRQRRPFTLSAAAPVAGPAVNIHPAPPYRPGQHCGIHPPARPFKAPSAIKPFPSSVCVTELLKFIHFITMSGQLACVNFLLTLFKETCYFCLTVFVQCLTLSRHLKGFTYTLLTQQINPTASVTSGILVSGICGLPIVTKLDCVFSLCFILYIFIFVVPNFG